MAAMGGLERDCNLLNYWTGFCSTPIVTVKATVTSAGFGWTGLDFTHQFRQFRSQLFN